MLLHDSSLLKTVTDPEVAYRILPRHDKDKFDNGLDTSKDVSPSDDEGGEAEVSAEWLLAHTREAQHPLLDVTTRPEAEESFQQYSRAGAEVLAIVDMGLVEVVRQVASQCVERGALLDALRQTLVDLTDSFLHVLTYSKERACEEAVHSLQLRRELEQERRRRMTLQAADAAHVTEMARLRAENERLGEKAAHLDLLMARAEAKRNRFDLEADSDDDHAALLKALEEEINAAAMNAMRDLYEAEEGLGKGGAPLSTRGEAPSAAEARRRQTDQAHTAERLYQVSYTLLRAMNGATEAMNEATAPLYNAMALNTVSRNANVAAGRWADVAREVGAFEVEKKHRYHTFQVFSDWCDRYQSAHNLHDDGLASRGDTDYLLNGSDTDDAALHASGSSPGHSPGRLGGAAEAIMSSSSVLMDAEGNYVGTDGSEGAGGDVVALRGSLRQSAQGARLSLQGRRHHIQDLVRAKIRKQQEDQNQSVSRSGGGDATGSHDAQSGEAQGEALHQVLQRIQYITAEDLLAMGVDDCSVDEVNAMFARDFDFRAYLQSQWEPRSSNYTLDLADVVDMVHDVTTTMQEMTLRMKALSQSAIVHRGVEPPLQPPSRPGDACVLCGRRDGASEEKRRRQETMRVIAHQVQIRMDQMQEKCQHAEADREVARNESRRLQAEVNAALQREQALRKQLRDLTDQMSTGSGKVVAAGRRSGGGSAHGSPLGSPARGRSPTKSAAGVSISGGSGSGGGGRPGSASARATPVASILTPHSGTSQRTGQGRRTPSPPLSPATMTAGASNASNSGRLGESSGLPTTSGDSGTAVAWGASQSRQAPSGRRQSAVVGIVTPDDGRRSPEETEGSGSPPRRGTLPPSAAAASASSVFDDSSESGNDAGAEDGA